MQRKSPISQLGRQILDILKEHGETQSQMANKIRISQSHLSRIITGVSFPSKELLNSIEIKYNRQLIMLLVKK